MASLKKYLILMACWVGISLSGCEDQFGTLHVLHDALAQGNSERIAHWTLKQTDGARIHEGLNALAFKVLRAKDNEEASFAIKWYLFTIDKVEDWPPDQVFPVANGSKYVEITTTYLVHHAFSTVAEDAFHGNHFSKELFDQLRTDSRHSHWLKDWQETADMLASYSSGHRHIPSSAPATAQ